MTRLDGGIGNDTIFAGDDNDLIIGGTGADQIYGQSGDDTINIEDGFGSDTIIGGETGETNGDNLDLTAVTQNVTVDLTAGSVSNPEDGTIVSGADTITFSEVEVLELGSGDDTLTGSTGNDNVYMGAGNDSADGGAGNDTLWGDLGADTLNGGDGADQLWGGSDNDSLTGGTLAMTRCAVAVTTIPLKAVKARTCLLATRATTISRSRKATRRSGGDGDDFFSIQDLGEAGSGTITITGGEGCRDRRRYAAAWAGLLPLGHHLYQHR